ncbi:hypothetical protein JCM10296v2_001047 [Rhodotorula toruloides]
MVSIECGTIVLFFALLDAPHLEKAFKKLLDLTTDTRLRKFRLGWDNIITAVNMGQSQAPGVYVFTPTLNPPRLYVGYTKNPVLPFAKWHHKMAFEVPAWAWRFIPVSGRRGPPPEPSLIYTRSGSPREAFPPSPASSLEGN